MRIDDSGARPEAPSPASTPKEPATTLPAATSEPTPAETRFRSCRWSVNEGGPAYCSNPEVLPYAGKSGFCAESWCLDCTLYKLRRKPPRGRRGDGYLY